MRTTTSHSGCVVRATAILLLFLVSARADIKNFTFNGTVSQIDDRSFILDGSITNGATFEGFYVFDPTAADANPDPALGEYHFTNSAFGVVVKVGNYVFRTNPQHVDFLIGVVDRPGQDAYVFRSYNNVCSQPVMVDHIAWQLDDPTGVALTNDLLAVTPPILASWQSLFGLTVSGGCDLSQSFFLRGTVDSISEAPPVIPDRPAVTVGDAIEVSFPTRTGYFYQIQRSDDMDTWTNIGEPVLGNGAVLSRFFTRRSGDKSFYRAEIANFQR